MESTGEEREAAAAERRGRRGAMASLSRFDTVELRHQGLSLRPRLRFHLSFTRSHLSLKPFDEWQLRQSLLSFLRSSLSLSVPDPDLSIRRNKDLHKSTRRNDEDAVASGTLYIWDLSALKGEIKEQKEDLDAWIQQKEAFIVDKLGGIELNLGGVKLKCHVHTDERDDFALVKRSWHKDSRAISTGCSNTIVVKGIPSRWLAELRISSKASVLVTHTIFSHFGTIRHVDIQENALEPFSCNVWVQFEHYSSFCNAVRAFCGRSMLKEGSSFKANYDVDWDNDEYFSEMNIRKRRFEKDQAEESRRRLAAFDARKVEIARRSAELMKLQHQKLENEQLERLREEEKARKEREAAVAEQEIEWQRKLQEMKEEEESGQEKLRKDQEMQNLIKLGNWDHALIKDNDQGDEKQHELEFQKEGKRVCKGEGDKNVDQKTCVMEAWSNKKHNSTVQRNREDKPNLKVMAYNMDSRMNKCEKFEVQKSRQDSPREYGRETMIEKHERLARQSKENNRKDMKHKAYEIETGADQRQNWDTQKNSENKHDVRLELGTTRLIDEDILSKKSLVTRRIDENYHYHHSPNRIEGTSGAERMQDSSEDNEFKRWELYGASGTSEDAKSFLEPIGISYNSKRIRSVIIDLKGV